MNTMMLKVWKLITSKNKILIIEFFFILFFLDIKLIGDTMENSYEVTTQKISINDRKNISIIGINNIEAFDSDEFIINTNFGKILLKGEELEILKLDVQNGNVSIKGKINSLAYIYSNISVNKEGVFKKIFK